MAFSEIVILSLGLVTLTTVLVVAGALSGNKEHKKRIDEVCKDHLLAGPYSHRMLELTRLPVGLGVYRTVSGGYIWLDIYSGEKSLKKFHSVEYATLDAVRRYHEGAIF